MRTAIPLRSYRLSLRQCPVDLPQIFLIAALFDPADPELACGYSIRPIVYVPAPAERLAFRGGERSEFLIARDEPEVLDPNVAGAVFPLNQIGIVWVPPL